MIEWRANPAGRRCYVGGYRLHHFWPGVAIAAASYPARRRQVGRASLAIGLAMMAHDARDFPFRDTDNH